MQGKSAAMAALQSSCRISRTIRYSNGSRCRGTSSSRERLSIVSADTVPMVHSCPEPVHPELTSVWGALAALSSLLLLPRCELQFPPQPGPPRGHETLPLG